MYPYTGWHAYTHVYHTKRDICKRKKRDINLDQNSICVIYRLTVYWKKWVEILGLEINSLLCLFYMLLLFKIDFFYTRLLYLVGCPGTHYCRPVQILLPLPHKCWDWRCVLPCLPYSLMAISIVREFSRKTSILRLCVLTWHLSIKGDCGIGQKQGSLT